MVKNFSKVGNFGKVCGDSNIEVNDVTDGNDDDWHFVNREGDGNHRSEDGNNSVADFVSRDKPGNDLVENSNDRVEDFVNRSKPGNDRDKPGNEFQNGVNVGWFDGVFEKRVVKWLNFYCFGCFWA